MKKNDNELFLECQQMEQFLKFSPTVHLLTGLGDEINLQFVTP